VPQTSPVCQLELSADSAGKLGVEFEGQGKELLSRLLEWLSRMLGLLLPEVSTWSSKAERGVLWWVESRVRHTPELSRAGGLPLLLPELLALVFQADGSIN
jgi:hypothetical protein